MDVQQGAPFNASLIITQRPKFLLSARWLPSLCCQYNFIVRNGAVMRGCAAELSAVSFVPLGNELLGRQGRRHAAILISIKREHGAAVQYVTASIAYWFGCDESDWKKQMTNQVQIVLLGPMV